MKKRKVLIIVIISMMLCANINAQQERRIIVNVIGIGLDPPIRRILEFKEITSMEELAAYLQIFESEYLDSEKWGQTPVYAGLDTLIENIIQAHNSFPQDADIALFMYSDFVDTDRSGYLFKSRDARRYAHNIRMLESYLINRLHEHVKRVYPIIVRGSQGTSNPELAGKICTSNERIYELGETDLMREDFFRSFQSSTIILHIIADHSNSLQGIVKRVFDDAKETITEAVNLSLRGNLAITMDDLIFMQGGPSFVGTENPRLRPDEIFFRFELSSYYVMRIPVSQRLYNQYLAYLGLSAENNPAKVSGNGLNQTNVSYLEVLGFVDWLNSQWRNPGEFFLITEFQLEHTIRRNPFGFSFGQPLVREMTSTYYAEYNTNETIDPIGASTGTHVSTRQPSYEDTNPQMLRPEYRGLVSVSAASPLTGFRLVLVIE